MAIMSLLLHLEPPAPTLFHHDIKYQKQVFWKYLYHAYYHLLWHYVFYFSIDHQYRSHQLQQYLKILREYLYEILFLRLLKHVESAACEDLWAIAVTGKPLKNQCNVLDHSFLVKCSGSFPGFHSYPQLLQRFFSRRTEYNFLQPQRKQFNCFFICVNY